MSQAAPDLNSDRTLSRVSRCSSRLAGGRRMMGSEGKVSRNCFSTSERFRHHIDRPGPGCRSLQIGRVTASDRRWACVVSAQNMIPSHNCHVPDESLHPDRIGCFLFPRDERETGRQRPAAACCPAGTRLRVGQTCDHSVSGKPFCRDVVADNRRPTRRFNGDHSTTIANRATTSSKPSCSRCRPIRSVSIAM